MADFEDADLRGSRFERAYLSGARFRSVDLAGAEFRTADLHGVVRRPRRPPPEPPHESVTGEWSSSERCGAWSSPPRPGSAG